MNITKSVKLSIKLKIFTYSEITMKHHVKYKAKFTFFELKFKIKKQIL